MKYITILFLIFLSCSKKNNKEAEPYAEKLDKLKSKYEFYLKESSKVKGSSGWILENDCDALLHMGLYLAGGGSKYEDIFKAKNDNGQWFRRPTKDCLEKGESKSTISRDMFLGLTLAALINKDSKTLSGVLKYARDHKFVMGDHDGSIDGRNRVIMTPTLYKLISDAYNHLAGKKVPLFKKHTLSLVYGYEDHLELISILIRGESFGAISDNDVYQLKNYVDDDPNNALAHAVLHKYTDGDQNDAVNILLRSDLWPDERLPESKDRCSPYLFMHGEKPSDWDGCPEEGKIHPGHDLILAASVIIN